MVRIVTIPEVEHSVDIHCIVCIRTIVAQFLYLKFVIVSYIVMLLLTLM